ncbi:MAG: DUF1697 domain-containing protein [Clostridiales bacterium]|nr:DUF1697 domain-containing protein [Clostridiales bacterium]
MKYIALLRGINISGKNKISMAELKKELQENNFQNVSTYLNSGNIIFESESQKKDDIIRNIKKIIKNKFNLEIPVFVMTSLELEDILSHTPDWWGTDNKEIYDNIIFIIPPTNCNEVFEAIGQPSENIDTIKEYNNIIFWSYVLKSYQKSNWWKKTASLSIKDRLTIRTANTMKKVLEICKK